MLGFAAVTGCVLRTAAAKRDTQLLSLLCKQNARQLLSKCVDSWTPHVLIKMDPTSLALFNTCRNRLTLVQRFKDSAEGWTTAVQQTLDTTLLPDSSVGSAAKQEVLKALRDVDLVPHEVYKDISSKLLGLLMQEFNEGKTWECVQHPA